MLLIIAGVLFLVWFVGFSFFRAVVGGAIHLILLLVLVIFIWHLIAHSHRSRHGAPTALVNAPWQAFSGAIPVLE
jgi:uncharacterized membrane protein